MEIETVVHSHKPPLTSPNNPLESSPDIEIRRQCWRVGGTQVENLPSIPPGNTLFTSVVTVWLFCGVFSQAINWLCCLVWCAARSV